MSAQVSGKTPFGRQMREKHFDLDPTYRPLNHGNSRVQ